MPTIASYIYLVILSSENMENIRLYTMLLKLLWSCYDIIIAAYTTLVLDLFGLGSSLIAILRFDGKKIKNDSKVLHK